MDEYKYSDNYVKRDKPEEMIEHSEHHLTDSSGNAKEYWKLGGIILVIAICASLMSSALGFDWQEWMRWFMGGFFVFFGSFKLIGYEDFLTMFPTYDPIAKRFKYYTYFYPFIELMLGFFYAANQFTPSRDIFTFVIFSIGALGIIKSIPKGETVRCACLGNVIKLPLSTVTVIENVTMSFMALTMIISYYFL
ncbi:MAG: hypothetical protein M3P98_01045 [bacterium]|nr:hypothetical protein [bacterium]